MRNRRIEAVLLMVVLLAALPAPAEESAGGIPWTEKIKGALAESASTGKPVFIDVWANWCVPCKHMDDTTYVDPAVVAAMNEFIPLKVDQDSSEIFCENHNVEGLPLVLYLDGDGREIGRRMGLQESDSLLESMAQVQEGYASYLETIERVKEPEAAESVASYLVAAGNPSGAVEILRRALKAAKGSEQAETLALRIAQAQLEDGEIKSACAGFKKLADGAKGHEVRGEALVGLEQAHRERGRTEEAEQAMERLRNEFPELAAEIEGDG
jgi:thioredoxin-like negative regulator of GroEL